ncbi:TraA [Roseibium sp. TrichSKD4]|uniref:AAA family ATPase n=1 Tax=Roseibium sp. TrichSKD4 TaxID=744980 RepID=UPI0001E565C6|nr:AAA family ATPase [Roseibium sp. TrichSKD4]EFO34231.1 TraA [Roseibium sp. TrichSKD4]
MILEGAQRGGAIRLAEHLLNMHDNDHVEVHEVSGFLSTDLLGALQEAEAISKGTRCRQFFFSVSLSPPQTEDVPNSVFETAITRIEETFGLEGQPRAIVFHEKKGRRHAHCVWSRIDVAKMKAINLPHFKRKLTSLARDLYIEHGWDMPDGFRDADQRDPLNYSNIEALQAKRINKDPKAIKQIFRQCWEASDSRAAFASALREHGFTLARGDRRGFVAVDGNGEVYSVARWVGEKTKIVRDRLGDLQSLPSVEEARGLRLKEAFEQSVFADPDQPLVVPLDEERLSNKEKVRHDPAHIIPLIADKKEEFTRSDILRGLADFIDNPMELHGALERALQCSDLVKFSGRGTEARYTSAEFQACKRDLMGSVHELEGRSSHHVDSAIIQKAIADENAHLADAYGASLSAEQEAAVKHVLSGKQLSSVVGLAGAGKSTMLKSAKSAWGKQGYRVIGAALSGKAADGLKSSSGITSRTLASLEHSWASGYERLDKNTVLVIDEAGMIGAKQLAKFVHEAARSGAKIVLVGDPEQLQPIQAGTPFKDIAGSVDTAKLTEVRRQWFEWQRQATRLFADGKNKEALSAYRENGCIIQTREPNEAIAKLAEGYLTDQELYGDEASRLALAHRRKDVHAINQTIRQMKKAAGELSHEALLYTSHGPRAFAVTDRIVLTKNDRTLGVKNGMLGTVEAIDEGQLTIRLDDEDGLARSVCVNPSLYSEIDHGYAITIHKSQGATVDRAFVLGSKTMDSHLSYVAMSRHREEVRLYADKASLRCLEKDRDEQERVWSRAPDRSFIPRRH